MTDTTYTVTPEDRSAAREAVTAARVVVEQLLRAEQPNAADIFTTALDWAVVMTDQASRLEEMQAEIERLRQKDRDALAWEARLAGHAWAAADNTHALAEQNEQLRGELAAQAVAEWNETHPVGTPVTYWPGVREGNGKASRTRTPAQVLNGHTAVVWVDGYSSCIALTHVEPGKVWDDSVAPGGWVCAWPHPDTASGICGYPVESEPCTRDHVTTIKFDKES